MTKTNRRATATNRPFAAGALCLLGLLLLSGCVQIGVHSTVAGDGTIEEYRMEITVSRTVYGLIESSAEEEGYDSVEAYLMADAAGESSVEADDGSLFGSLGSNDAERVSYEETFDGDRVTMTITIEGVDPPTDGPITITEEDGQLVYEDLSFVNETAADSAESEFAREATAGFAVDYYLTMPGEITDSNADAVDGNTAEWHATGSDAFTGTRIYAVSETPTSVSVDGFGVGVALVAMVVAVVLATARRR